MVKYGNRTKFKRSEHVDVVVREVTLTPDGEDEGLEYYEIREFYKIGEVYGHGILIPAMQSNDLIDAIVRLEQAADRREADRA